MLGGITVLAAIALFLWIIAAYISDGDVETSDRLAPDRFTVASVETAAAEVADNGPILFPGLNTTTGERSIVLDHEGDEPEAGWRIYFAYPADSDPSCAVTQIQGTAQFVDCTDRQVPVTDLAPPTPGFNPVVEDGVLYIDLRATGG